MANTYYISPSGNDSSGNGTIGSPWRTITKGWSVLAAGDTLYCRGGSYTTSGSQSLSSKNGSAGNLIKIWAYPGEFPVFTWGGSGQTSQIRGWNFSNVTYIHIKGIRITSIVQGSGQGGSYNYGLSMNSSDHNCIIENVECDHIGGTGIQVGANCNGNLLLNCDSHHNDDPFSSNGAHENSNGYELAQNVQGVATTIRYCRAWWNGDDGFDCYNGQGALTFDGCWSFWNGFVPGTFNTAGNGQGYKMGPTPSTINSVLRTITKCLAFGNRVFGFDYNSGGFQYKAIMYNNTAYANNNVGFYFGDATLANIFKNNLAYGQLGGGGQSGALGSGFTQSNNSWQGAVTVTNADFLSVSNVGMDGARQADGSLPILNFMKLASGSDLINAGVDVGLSFLGAAPDMGAFEFNPGGNISPVVNAGVDQTITLPVNSVSVTGTAIDSDGTIASVQWTKISGGAATINSPTSLTTTITNLVQGSYTFRFSATDNLGAVSTNDMVVTVNAAIPPNLPPVVNAGPDQTIALPTSTITFAGSATDADGSIASHTWTKLSGPSGGTITTAGSYTSTVTGITLAGTYVFQLSATDDDGASATDTMTLIVNPVPNVPPVSNANVNQTITLPTSSVTLSGSGTDSDGTITGYLWTRVSGPNTPTIVSATSASTNVTGLIAGTYIFNLRVTDNSGAQANDTMSVLVNPAPNVPPISDAGVNQTITLPTSSVTLSGSGTDADGTISAYLWTRISGPNTPTITTATSASTGITGMIAGTYVFQLRVTDNGGLQATDTVTVIVNAAAPPNNPPISNAGVDKTITLPTSSVSLVGSGTDTDGTISAYLWTRISGPNTPTIVSATSSTTSITGLIQGTYVFRLQVTDNLGSSATDTATVIVNPAPNVPPVVDAGVNQNVTLPTSSTALLGSATDSDGTIASYAWTNVSGPNTPSITSPTAATTNVTGLIAGTYIFRLTATDDDGATGTDTVTVVVNAQPPNIVPVANAGVDKILVLPSNTDTLLGSGTDVDGTIVSYSWAKTSGPATYTIISPTAATTVITGLIAGTYVFTLTVTDDDGGTDTDTTTVTVLPAANAAPISNAGANQTIILPTATVTLTGSGTDSDGTIAAYLWTFVSGPTVPSITTPTTASTDILGLSVTGTYVFNLKVTDDDGAIGNDSVSITVNPIPTTQTIQAEAYVTKSGPTTETCYDTGGGLDLRFGLRNQYATYSVNVPVSGSYTMTFRVASSHTGGQFQLRKADNAAIITVTTPNTGGSQTWTTVTKTVTLTAGVQTMKIVATRSISWRINYFTLSQA